MAKYTYDPGWSEERRRLASIEAAWDPFTTRHITELGIAEGWQCLEIGGGGGSVAQWLSERVGDTGRVLATDLDTRFLEQIEAKNLTAIRHDITSEPLPEGEFDLVHSRLLLEHLAGREDALKQMSAALKPGGVLLAEDYDFATGTVIHPPDPVHERVTNAVLQLMTMNGFDAAFGRSLPSRLVEHGLADVGAEGHVLVVTPSSPLHDFYRLSLIQVRDLLVQAGLLNGEEIDHALTRLGDPGVSALSPIMMSTWGFKP